VRYVAIVCTEQGVRGNRSRAEPSCLLSHSPGTSSDRRLNSVHPHCVFLNEFGVLDSSPASPNTFMLCKWRGIQKRAERV
jgi:hypothetical protein